MSKYFTYDENGKMIFSDFSCSCGLEHRIPTQSVYIKSGLLEKIPEMIREKELGTHCVVVCDNNTYKVAGKRVIEILERAGFDVIRCVINREGEMLPDETAVGEVLLSIQPETEFLVSVGSGSVTDTTRVNATRTGLPFVAVATAPSMDGYTSVVSPLVFRKVKIHRTGVCPEIVARAPHRFLHAKQAAHREARRMPLCLFGVGKADQTAVHPIHGAIRRFPHGDGLEQQQIADRTTHDVHLIPQFFSIGRKRLQTQKQPNRISRRQRLEQTLRRLHGGIVRPSAQILLCQSDTAAAPPHRKVQSIRIFPL